MLAPCLVPWPEAIVLSGYNSEYVGFFVDGKYWCLGCARERLGELRVSRIVAGLASVPGDEKAWDPNALVSRYEVEEKLAEIDAIKAEGRRTHKRIDWDAVNGEEWGTRCDRCGVELAPPEPRHALCISGVGDVCRYCWEVADHPLHKVGAA